MSTVCKSCGRCGSMTEVVALWDTCTYCRDCAEKSCRGLFEFGQANNKVEEVVDAATFASLRPSIWWWINMSYRPIVLYAIGIVSAFAGMTWPGILVCGAASCFGVAKCVLLYRARSLLWPDVSAPMRIVCSNGCIECWRGEKCVAKGPVAEWSWWNAGRGHELSRNPPIMRLVVLGAPRLSKDRYYVCGCTSEMRNRWIGWLTLADVPRLEHKVKWPPSL